MNHLPCHRALVYLRIMMMHGLQVIEEREYQRLVKWQCYIHLETRGALWRQLGLMVDGCCSFLPFIIIHVVEEGGQCLSLLRV